MFFECASCGCVRRGKAGETLCEDCRREGASQGETIVSKELGNLIVALLGSEEGITENQYLELNIFLRTVSNDLANLVDAFTDATDGFFYTDAAGCEAIQDFIYQRGGR